MIFNRDKDSLLLTAASDTQRMRKVVIILDYQGMVEGYGETNFGGTVTYCKKLRKFTHIQYSDRRNWAVSFSITSKVAFFAYDHYQSMKKVFPFGASRKKLTAYLLNN